MIFDELIKENKEAFIAKVTEISAYLGVKPEWLMFVMWFETAHTLNSHIQNSIKATGLIQFMPDTAKGLGTTVEALKIMSNVDQLDYVKKHLSRFKGQYKSITDLYCAIFWPAAVGKSNTYKVGNSTVAKQNPIFDLDKNGQILKSEIESALKNQMNTKIRGYFA